MLSDNQVKNNKKQPKPIVVSHKLDPGIQSREADTLGNLLSVH